MFFCEKCRVKNEWPKGIRGRPTSHGPCEMCRKKRDCYDIPSYALPLPKKGK